jgi:hypothetical protein
MAHAICKTRRARMIMVPTTSLADAGREIQQIVAHALRAAFIRLALNSLLMQ